MQYCRERQRQKKQRNKGYLPIYLKYFIIFFLSDIGVQENVYPYPVNA